MADKAHSTVLDQEDSAHITSLAVKATRVADTVATALASAGITMGTTAVVAGPVITVIEEFENTRECGRCAACVGLYAACQVVTYLQCVENVPFDHAETRAIARMERALRAGGSERKLKIGMGDTRGMHAIPVINM